MASNVGECVSLTNPLWHDVVREMQFRPWLGVKELCHKQGIEGDLTLELSTLEAHYLDQKIPEKQYTIYKTGLNEYYSTSLAVEVYVFKTKPFFRFLQLLYNYLNESEVSETFTNRLSIFLVPGPGDYFRAKIEFKYTNPFDITLISSAMLLALEQIPI